MLKHWLLTMVLALASAVTSLAAQQPNIVLIYADDLGYGDVSAYGAKTIQTPNMDRIAKEGLRFNSGYATSATCTPSRYSLLTGEYAWRQKGTGILPGSAALIIKPGRTTLPAILQKAGYQTGVVGKWHLGLGDNTLDWNGEIKPGPLEIGFNYSYIMAATGDRVPCVYVENHRVVGLDPKDPIEVSYGKPIEGVPTGKANPELLTKQKPSHGHDMSVVNGISRIGYMKGGKSALWTDEDMADVFTGKAVQFIEKNKAKPFFLFFALHDPHVPRVPHPRFVGKSGMGPRGDAIIQADWCTGEILKALEKLKLTENTIVILSSDNGPVIDDGYHDDAVKLLGNHKPSGPFRGGKYSKFEAGTRVPFLVRWPAKIKPGVSEALVSQVDLLASFAALTGQQPNKAESPDSQNILAALIGESKTGREHIVEHGNGLALRVGNWKYIEPSKGPKVNKNTNTEMGNDEAPQLYDLGKDVGEKKNLAVENPEKVKEMQAALERVRNAQP